MKERITSTGSPRPIGPYSQAIVVDGLVFCSGQGPMDPETGAVIDGGIVPQTERTLRNLGAVLEAAGAGYADVLKTTCYLADIDEFAAFNEVYGRFFPDTPPARTTIEAARLPLDIRVEIEAIAKRP